MQSYWVDVTSYLQDKDIKTISLITSHVFMLACLALYNGVYYITAININSGGTTLNAPTVKCIIGYK